MSTARSILEALQSAIVTRVNGTAPYIYDLSAAGQVQIGRFAGPPAAPPFVAIELVEVTDEDATTRSMESAGAFTIIGWVKASPKSGSSKVFAALDLGDDIRRALRADRGLGDERAIGLHCTFSPLPEETQDRTGGYARFVGVVSVKWREPLP